MIDTRQVILSDQLKNLDWQFRNAEFICETSPEILKDLFYKLKHLFHNFSTAHFSLEYNVVNINITA